SAAGIPYNRKIELFYNLLGFEVGKPNIAIRKITDVYLKLNNSEPMQITEEWMKKLGKGGLIFVSPVYGKEFVEKLYRYLRSRNINVDRYDKKNAIQNLATGKVDYLLGIASYNNPLTRGIDLQYNIYYCIFVGLPKFVFNLDMENIDKFLGSVLGLLRNVFIKQLMYPSSRYDRLLKYLRKGGRNLPSNLCEIRDEILQILKKEENIKKINESPEAAVLIHNGRIKISVSDITGYLQASGRISRLSKLGITQGLSLILCNDLKTLNHLVKKIRFFIDDFNIPEGNEDLLVSTIKKIKEERESLLTSNTQNVSFKDSKLIIVESPHKARTIASFFGRPLRRRIGPVELYETLSETSSICIAATKGHITDLSHDKFFGVEKNNGMFLPQYLPLKKCSKCNRNTTLDICRKDQIETTESGSKVITALRKLSYEADEIYIATDPDAEGEKIAFDIFNILYPLNQKVKRIEFHEVTKKALFNALGSPRNINLQAVKSQFLRRISDRWIGFAISNKLQDEFSNLNLSAGRVQTPILGWIIKRMQEYKNNKIYCTGVTFANFVKPLTIVFKFQKKKEATTFYKRIKKITLSKIASVEKIISPPPPFTTDTMLQSAIKVLKKSAHDIMRIAQELYEFGYITYHRTDSLHISGVGINIAKEYLKDIGKDHLFKYRNYPQGTHEAIRPTKAIDAEELKSDLYTGLHDIPLSNEHLALYNMIFTRFLASQMKEVKVIESTYEISSENIKTQISIYEKVIEEGFNVITPIYTYTFDKAEYEIDEKYNISKKLWSTSETELYTQATLIEDMKKYGLGRPSTYSSIIQKLFERGYVFEFRNKLIPLKNGKIIYEYLTDATKHKIAMLTKPFVSQEYTAQLEKNIDDIENGKDCYWELLSKLHNDISKIINQ
ncbi:MAG: reverse gyrase, partial [Planctomycetota bacterium]